MAKILVVEDDPTVRASVVDWLVLEKHQVEQADNGADALQLLSGFSYELVILDWELPDLSGPEILKRFRAAGGSAQVLFLTGKGDSESKTTGLDAGADDYLVKPVDLAELSARIRSRLRRPGQYQPLITQVGALRLDANQGKVYVSEKPIHMTTKEFAVLEFLMRNRGRRFTAGALRDQIWPSDSEIVENTVRVCIQSIRRKLGTEAGDILKSVAGAGYTIDD